MDESCPVRLSVFDFRGEADAVREHWLMKLDIDDFGADETWPRYHLLPMGSVSVIFQEGIKTGLLLRGVVLVRR